MKKIFLSILLLLIPFLLYSQVLPKVTPNSPVTAELMKYGDIPVSNYTGVPSIIIPLYEINVSGYSLPITLSYHASGVKVSEVGANVGLGWSLNAGGVIGVNAVGANDELSDRYNIPDYQKNNFFEELKSGILDKRPNLGNDVYNTPEYIVTMVQRILNNEYDVEPDFYTYNFNNNIGKFIKANDNSYYSYPFNKLKIIKHPNEDIVEKYKWKLVSDTGVKYFFGLNATIFDFNTIGNEYFLINEGLLTSEDGFVYPNTVSFLPSAWYLRKIKIPWSASEINFKYKSAHEKYFSPKSHSLVWKKTNAGSIEVLNNKINLNETNVYEFKGARLIEEIVADNCTVSFFYDIARNDIDEGSLLSKIIIYDKAKNVPIKTVLFTYDNNSERVFLKTVKESGKPAYQFSYYQGLSDRFSFSQDYWGFYNGANNTSLLTDKPYSMFGSFLPAFFKDEIADREPNILFASAGSLKQIIYPTGGKTEFVYESNTYSKSYYPLIVNEEKNNVYVKSLEIELPEEEVFNLKNNELIEFNMSFRNYTFPPNNSSGVLLEPVVILKNLDTNWSKEWRATDFEYDQFSNDAIGNNKKAIYFDEEILLNSGNYKIIANVEEPDSGFYFQEGVPKSDVSFSYCCKESTNEPEKIAGGLRIKNVKNFIGDSLISEKKYEYKFNDSLSSGHLKYRMLNNEKSIATEAARRYTDTGPYSCGPNFEKYSITSSDIFPRGFISNNIGYEQVTEFKLGNKKRGKTIFNYKYVTPGESGTMFPYLPMKGNFFMNGLLVKKTIFESVNDNYKEISVTENDYKYLNLNNYYEGIAVGKYIDYDYSCNFLSGDIDQIVSRYYQIKFKWPYLNKTINKKYFNSRQDSIVSSVNYFYDNINHLQPTRIEKANSKGDTTKTRTYYAHDLNEVELINQHRIAEPIKKEIYKNIGSTDIKLSEQRTFYKDFSGNYLPEFIKTSKGSQPLEDRIVYHSYDNKGNPIEVSKKDGTKIYYVWGYQQTQPIAKIENYTSTNQNQQTAINNAVIASNEDDDTCLDTQGCNEKILRDTLRTLRNAFPNAQVTTFTYDPLIGVTSITDPRGETTYYHYDNFNRLEFVKDKDGNILSKNEYHYKN